jgi:hypothetical protein
VLPFRLKRGGTSVTLGGASSILALLIDYMGERKEN